MPTTLAPAIKLATTGTITKATTTSYFSPVALDLATEVSPDNQPLTVTAYPHRISGVYIHVHNIAGGCNTLTLKISPDSAGDECLLPDTAATISFGLTNVARGGAVWKVEIDAFLNTDIIYWSVKTNAGTCDIKEVRFVYEHAV
jgi:hypothetical protein